jgi:hypothetical protein
MKWLSRLFRRGKAKPGTESTVHIDETVRVTSMTGEVTPPNDSLDDLAKKVEIKITPKTDGSDE